MNRLDSMFRMGMDAAMFLATMFFPVNAQLTKFTGYGNRNWRYMHAGVKQTGTSATISCPYRISKFNCIITWCRTLVGNNNIKSECIKSMGSKPNVKVDKHLSLISLREEGILYFTKMRIVYSLMFACLFLAACGQGKKAYDPQPDIDYCVAQVKKTLVNLPIDTPNIPRNITDKSGKWNMVNYKDWTSGFWPGILWYAYEASGDDSLRRAADRFTRQLTPLSREPAMDHDLGFQVFNSFGTGYLLTHKPDYKEVILATADTLATLFNPRVGTILSWPRSVPHMQWPQHNTIIDNMINLELLFWAAKNGGGQHLYDIAVSHARKTMEHHFRPDFSAYHAVIYDRDSGAKVKGLTHQGYSDGSMWARGQAWAIYGYTLCYRETGDREFLDFAQKVTQVYLDRLPDDLVPYWDFNDPAIPDAPRDASAAAVVASALLEMAQLLDDKQRAAYYHEQAVAMLASLSASYQTGSENSAFLKHVTGHKPNNSEIDASINYADYYYLEALLRLKNSKMYKKG